MVEHLKGPFRFKLLGDDATLSKRRYKVVATIIIEAESDEEAIKWKNNFMTDVVHSLFNDEVMNKNIVDDVKAIFEVIPIQSHDMISAWSNKNGVKHGI